MMMRKPNRNPPSGPIHSLHEKPMTNLFNYSITKFGDVTGGNTFYTFQLLRRDELIERNYQQNST